jgi:hypothetical protein
MSEGRSILKLQANERTTEMANRKDLKQIIQVATKHGWVIAKTKAGHLKWTAPSGIFFFSSSTPSDWRGLERMKQDLKHSGFDLKLLKK